MKVKNHNLYTINNTNDLCFMDMEIDNLINAFNHKIWKPKLNFINNINVIIKELKQYYTFVGLNIYEVLVSCGNELKWDQEYYISTEDLNWFKNYEGKKYFLSSLNEKNTINTIEEYRVVMDIYFKLIELFELQL
tara:strand:- start:17 stop:421 length:405 start_codon:yes stop_codon:yes gene_type:complete